MTGFALRLFAWLQAIFCVIYVSIVYYMTSQPPELSRYYMFMGACLLISFVAQSVGLVVGAAMNVQVSAALTSNDDDCRT